MQTGASGTYDATMSSELAKSNAPTMFNISGFDQFAKYQKYCEPLQDTEAYKLLTDDGKAYSYTIDGDSFTLPYAAEWYGIIYNKKIINDYASKDYAVIKSADDIKDYKTLKAVAHNLIHTRRDHTDFCLFQSCIQKLTIFVQSHRFLTQKFYKFIK